MPEDREKIKQDQFRTVVDSLPGVQFLRFVNKADFDIISKPKHLIESLPIKGSTNERIAQWLRPILEERRVCGDYIFAYSIIAWPILFAQVHLSDDFEWLKPLIETQIKIRTFGLYFIRPDNKFYLKIILQESGLEAQIAEI